MFASKKAIKSGPKDVNNNEETERLKANESKPHEH